MTVREDRIRAKMAQTDDPAELAKLEEELARERARPARSSDFEPPLKRKQMARLLLDRKTEAAMEFLANHIFEDGRPWAESEIRRRAICELAERLGWEYEG